MRVAVGAKGKDFWLSALRGDGAAFLAVLHGPTSLVVAGDPLAAPVPSCPGWTLGDLTRHLGAVYRRTRLHAGSAELSPWGKADIPPDAPPPSDAALLGWFAAELAALDAFLDALDPDAPTWNWAPQANVAAFWHRRMAHETAIHRWDAQVARGLPEPIEAKLAADTVAEALDTFLAGGRRFAPHPVEGLVRLHATDLGQSWHIRFRGTAIAVLDTDTLLDDSAHRVRATATGSASDLALALWGRVGFEVLATAGDPALLTALRVR